jgi:DUF4097 and DUF4098 domain-containing protein YvlB
LNHSPLIFWHVFAGTLANRIHMTRKIMLCALLAGSVLTTIAQRNNNEVLIEQQSVAAAGIQHVKADADFGNISVEGVSGTDARVEVYAWSRDDEKETKERFNEFYDVSIASKNGTLTVFAKRKKQRDDDISVSLRLYVPPSASSELSTKGGNIHCAKLAGGKQQVMTKGGNIAFDEIKGNVSGNTSGGNISIVNCSETIDVKTSGGNIHCQNSQGQLTLYTSGGNIAMEELNGTIKAQTSGGNVSAEQVDGTLNTSTSGGNLSLRELSCALDASTSGGNVDVSILKMVQYVKLANRGSGHTQLRLPGGAGVDLKATGHTVKINPAANFKGDMSEKEYKGTVNGGGLPVTIDGGDSRVVVNFSSQ